MSFIVSALPAEPFRPLFGLSDEVLAERGVIRRTVDAKPGFPCRVSLEDAEPGETVLLLNYEHQSADTPFRASHAIYVREGGPEADLFPICSCVISESRHYIRRSPRKPGFGTFRRAQFVSGTAWPNS